MTNTTPKKNIPSLSGLKFIAVIGIIACHLGYLPGWDMCARMVEMLFVLSGFLMAYNYYQTPVEPSLKSGAGLVLKKLPRFYPVHLTAFFLQLFFVAVWSSKPLTYHLTTGVLNLTLQHAWFQGTHFSYNNVSWFLSALIFCYFLTPTLAGLVKDFAEKKRLFKLFVILVAVRAFLEYIALYNARFTPIVLHTNPLVQCLNYSFGYIASVWFITPSALNKSLKNGLSPLVITWLEGVILGAYLTACYWLNGYAWRLFFILSALPVVYVLALNRGSLARLFSLKPLLWGATLTLEIFMFHSFILYYHPAEIDNPLYILKFTTLTLLTAILFRHTHRLIQKRLLKN